MNYMFSLVYSSSDLQKELSFQDLCMVNLNNITIKITINKIVLNKEMYLSLKTISVGQKTFSKYCIMDKMSPASYLVFEN